MHVTYYHRRPMATNFSVERLFRDLRKALPSTVHARVVTSPFTSRGLARRVFNIIEAPFFQGDVNHITGDVHYLCYLLDKHRTLLTILDNVTLNRLRGWKRYLFYFFWYWVPEKRCRLISVISESTRAELLKYLPAAADKIRIVYCPVSDDFKPNPKIYKTQSPTLLQVGTGKNKNLDRVAKALKGIDCHLRIIGRLSREQAAILNDNTVDYSWVANISDAQVVQEYNNADIVVFVSTYEGFGLPIIEAQATGRPVITSHIRSMPEVAGEGACFVDPFSVGSVREGIQNVINDAEYRERLINCGFQNVERFKAARIADEYVKLYREISGADQ